MEPENRRQTESPADHLHLQDSARASPTAAETANPSETPTVLNADNERFQPYMDEDGNLTGDVDEVNGLGATEVPFTPTRHELLLLVKHYALLELKSVLRVDDPRYYGFERWPLSFASCRLTRAENLLGTDVVQRAFDEVEREFRHSAQLTLRDWDIFCHGTYDERTELHAKRDAEAKARMQEEFRMERLLEEREESREQKEMEEWREQHQAARDAERKKASADRFMMECIKIAEQVADAPDERARALQMAALAAKAVARLATNELIDNDTQQQAALLAGRLIDSLQLEVP